MDDAATLLNVLGTADRSVARIWREPRALVLALPQAAEAVLDALRVAAAVADAPLRVAAAAADAQLRVAAVPDAPLRVAVAVPDARLRVAAGEAIMLDAQLLAAAEVLGASRASLRAWRLPAAAVGRAIRAAAVPPGCSAARWGTAQASTESRARSPSEEASVGRLASNPSAAAAGRQLLVTVAPTASSPPPASSRAARPGLSAQWLLSLVESLRAWRPLTGPSFRAAQLKVSLPSGSASLEAWRQSRAGPAAVARVVA